MGQFSLGVLLIGFVVIIAVEEIAIRCGVSAIKRFLVAGASGAVAIFVLSSPVDDWLAALFR